MSQGNTCIRTGATKAKQSEANKRAWQNLGIRKKYLIAFAKRDYSYTVEALKKGQETLEILRKNEEWIKKLSLAISIGRKGVKMHPKDPVAFSKMQSEKSKKRVFTLEYRKRLSEARRKCPPMSAEARIRSSVAHKKMWENPEFARKMALAHRRKPNKSELRLDDILKRNFGGEWKYVGDGEVWINGKNPDFININGKKKIIELFSVYWHKERARTNDDELDRKTHYKKYGFDCLIIWQEELKNEEILVDKIRGYI